MDSLPIKAAVAFATAAHEGQMYGDAPYTVHLAHVFEVLKRFKISDEELLVASFLHDVVEDTNTSLFQVEATFGRGVADLVHRVTNERGINRKERHLKTYPKIKESERATTLKLADRIANTENAIEHNNDIINMYKKEYPDFKEALYKAGSNESMWRHLDFLMGENRGQITDQ